MSQPPDSFEHGGVHNEEYDPGQDPDWNVPQQGGPPQQPPGNNVATGGEDDFSDQPNFGGNAMDEARRIAAQVVDICDHNFVELNKKKYLKLEAWQAIAYSAGTVPGILIVKDSMIAGVAGVMARSTLKDAKGKTLSEAEGFVGSDEDFWQRQPVQSRVNMAQTRAVSRVCRLVFSFVVQIMNQEHGRQYEVTPADEMQAVMDNRRAQPPQPPPQPGQRHLMQPQAPQQWAPSPQGPAPAQFPDRPMPSTVYPTPQSYPSPQQQQPSFMPPPFQPSNLPTQTSASPPRNYQLGAQGAQVWQGILQNVEIKWVNTPKGQSQMFIIHLGDQRNGTTFDKKLAAAATANIGVSVELGVSERANKPGSFNVLTMRVLQ